MDVQFGYWMPLGSGGMVISNLKQRTDWTLSWNAQMAQRAESSGFEYGLAPARFIARHGWEYQQEPTICAAVLAAQTQRLKLITAVHTGLWHPAMIAKQVATLDVFSGGRPAGSAMLITQTSVGVDVPPTRLVPENSRSAVKNRANSGFVIKLTALFERVAE